MYDNTCKFLVENFSQDFATWLLGKPIELTKIEPSELASDPIRADSVILLESAEIIVHLEFQTKTDDTMPYRMANYWLRLYGKYRDREIHQTVIYLRPTNSSLAYQTSFNSIKLNHEFNVIRLWEQPTETFQQYQGLLPLAVLTNTNNPEATLRDIAKLIDQIADQKVKSDVAAATSIISGLALNKEIIQRLLRSEIMKESVIYQEILLEGLAEGKAQGLAQGEAQGLAKGKTQGKTEATNQIAINLLRSNISIEVIAQVTGLTLKQVQKLQKLSEKQTQIVKLPRRSPKN
ncbi:Rpn family recombination-promoting nuclease/putative transposase [Pseudanabaena sp. FACHB-1998]|uniref:Rpn family recombination-promoting nuclease/putative transposase n=1 Tax=Pseudanabaena sp. FACHB-1998 TaxID=2692858 RepID=UPI0016805573|nr:Rpn family recombination-promoting nuclease/putative transposase [Pseudanabaena sp. FACHB-1998]MBD2176718.1 Rpn family recombination-promoting nuclease/putative transposase [Pseudanabaena sp. FACHB-1998]